MYINIHNLGTNKRRRRLRKTTSIIGTPGGQVLALSCQLNILSHWPITVRILQPYNFAFSIIV